MGRSATLSRKKKQKAGFVRQRMTELIGVVLAVLACYYLLALTTYTQTDPSFNTTSNGIIINGGGLVGAYIADMALQLNGMASGLVFIALLAWSWRLMSKSYLRGWWLRISALCVSLVSVSAMLAVFTAPASWALESGLGGAIGDVVTHQLLGFLPSWIVVSIVAILSLIMLPIALGLQWSEWVALTIMCRQLVYQVSKIFHLIIAALRGSASPLVRHVDSEEHSSWKDRLMFWKRPEIKEKSAKPKAKRKVRKIVEPSRRDSKAAEKSQPSLELRPKNENYGLPSVQLLDKVPAKRKGQQLSESALQQNAQMLESVLSDFGVHGEITRVRPGPVVTLYELEPAAGTKSSRVIGLADDIARSMSAISARISVIPGRNALGIELPNMNRETVYLRESIEEKKFQETECKLPLILGKDIGGDPIIADLARMPHLLVAGTTGSGKSVAINTMIMSLVYHLPPEQCKFIMIDPKMLELSVYDDIPHLLSPVVTEPNKAVVALKWTVREMENRYRLMSNLGVRNVDNYNKRIKDAAKRGEELTRTVQTGFDPDTGKPLMERVPLEMTPLPYIVVVVDEMADLMLVAGKDIEGSIQRLAQMARAAGIHIIMATQRPSVDVITGVIKANFPTRVSFQVTSKIDSRTILGEQGAEQLLGQGDMLYMAGGGRITRVHGPFISDKEVEKVVDYLKTQGTPEYDEAVITEEDDGGEMFGMTADDDPETNLYRQAVQIVLSDRKASTSYIQRKLKIGYNRAARLIDKMEEEGIVGQANHVGKREVLGRTGEM